jgi:hypothetical protein
MLKKFYAGFQRVTEYGYHTDNVMEFTSRRLQWIERLAWTDSKKSRRWACNVGDFLLIQRQHHRCRDMPTNFIVLRLAQLFAYYFLDIPYLFAVSNVMDQIESTGAQMEDLNIDFV